MVEAGTDANAPDTAMHGCSTAIDCNALECQTATCVAGSCGYAVVPDQTPCSRGVCLAGGCGFPPEFTYPWSDGACSVLGRMPPPFTMSTPVIDRDGIWMGSENGMVLHMANGAWHIQFLQEGGAFDHLYRVGTALYAVSAQVGLQPAVFVRRNGVWLGFNDFGGLMSGVTILGGSGDLFASDSQGIAYYAGGGWTRLASTATIGTIRQVWGDRTNMYVAHSLGLAHWDGVTLHAIPVSEGATVAVGGSSATNVFAVTPTSVYQVNGDSLTLVSGLCTTQNTAPAAFANGALALVCTDGVHRRNVAGWDAPIPAGQLDASGMPAPCGISDSGDIVATGGAQWNGSAWVSLPVIPAPPAESVAVLGGAEPFVGGHHGIAQHDPATNQWIPVPGTSGWTVSDLWQAADGVLFAGALDNAGNHIVARRDGTTWSTTYSTPPGQSSGPLLAGRSSGDVYAAVVGDIQHWDGTSWQSLNVTCSQLYQHYISAVVATGAHSLYALCEGSSAPSWSHYDGASWSDIPSTSNGPLVQQLGPTNAPTGLLAQSNSANPAYQIVGDAVIGVAFNWPATFPFGPTPVASGNGHDYVGFDSDGVLRSTGLSSSTLHPSSVLRFYARTMRRIWTDGRRVLTVESSPTVAASVVQPGDDRIVVSCDTGP
jgi:hypothetical protein